jgi:hypothetical protein
MTSKEPWPKGPGFSGQNKKTTMKRNRILIKRDGINAAGQFFYPVLRPMLGRILLVVTGTDLNISPEP